MSDTVWFRRGDGLEIEVRAGSVAEKLLKRQGARRIDGPGAPSVEVPAPAAPATKAELAARAAELGIEVPAKATKAQLEEAIAAEEQRLADEAAAQAAADAGAAAMAEAQANAQAAADAFGSGSGS